MANEAKDKLIAWLNDDLALELAGIVRAVYQASTAGGLLGHELRELLQKELPVELQHAQFLADKIAILGGTPTTMLADVALPVDVAKMIDEDIATEWKIVARLRARAGQAERFCEFELKDRMEATLAEHT